MKIEYVKLATQEHPVVAEVYDGTDRDQWGEHHPLEKTSRGYLPTSCMIVKPDIHEVMAMDHDAIIATGCVNAAYLRESKPTRDFSGGTMEDLRKRRKGWPEGVKKVQETIAKILPDGIFAKRPRPHWAEDGYDLCLERFRDSHDRPSLNRELRRGSRNIGLAMQYGENCGTEAEHLFLRGAATIAAIDTLETMGYRCDLTAVSSNHGVWPERGEMTLVMLTTVKRASEPVDMDYLASTMASPLFFRGNMFAWWCAAPWAVHSALGHMVDMPKCFYEDVTITNLPNSVEAAKTLYEKIVATAHEKMSRKVLHHEKEMV